MKYFAILILALFTACAPKPTKIKTESPILSRQEMQKKKLSDATVILDVRAPFEFNLSHIAGAINVAWEDFSRRPPDVRGLIERDLHSITRRLALIGIDKATPVLVVGNGKLGKGEEGRVAWTLESLGIENVQLALSGAYRELKGENPQKQNKIFWDTVLNPDLMVTWAELKSKIEGTTYVNTKARRKSLESIPLPLKNHDFVILDVRSKEEFSIDNLSQRTPRQFKLQNLDWREFFTDEMDPNPAMVKTLHELGVSQMTDVYLISNHGVRSGAVAWALRKLGYTKAQNFAGGYEQVVFKRK